MRNQEPPQWNIKVPAFSYYSRTQEEKMQPCTSCCLHTEGPSQETGGYHGGEWFVCGRLSHCAFSEMMSKITTWKKCTIAGIWMVKAISSILISLFIFRRIFQYVYTKCTYTANRVMGKLLHQWLCSQGTNLRPRLCPNDPLLQPYCFLRQLKSGFGFIRYISSTFWREKKSYKPQRKNQGIVSLWIAHEACNIVTKPWEVSEKLTPLKGKPTFF